VWSSRTVNETVEQEESYSKREEIKPNNIIVSIVPSSFVNKVFQNQVLSAADACLSLRCVRQPQTASIVLSALFITTPHTRQAHFAPSFPSSITTNCLSSSTILSRYLRTALRIHQWMPSFSPNLSSYRKFTLSPDRY
jgi:hypothetical protein